MYLINIFNDFPRHVLSSVFVGSNYLIIAHEGELVSRMQNIERPFNRLHIDKVDGEV